MEEKKTEVITFRTEKWVKERLEAITKKNKWSLAQLVNQLCMNFLVDPKPNQITVKGEDIIKMAIIVRQEGSEKGVELTINVRANEEETDLIKELTYDMIECGGLGCIAGGDPLKEMTPDEILEIP